MFKVTYDGDSILLGLSARPTEPGAWLQNNIARPLLESTIHDIWDPLATTLNAVPHCVTGKDWLPKVKIDETDRVAPNNALEYSVQMLIQGGIGAVTYATYGRLAGGLLRKGVRAQKIGGKLGGFLSSESFGQVAGAAVHDSLLDADNWQSRGGNVAGGVASFATFELLNKSIKNRHWLVRAIAHAPIGFAGGGTGYLSREVVSGHSLDAQAAMQSSVDGAAMNLLLPGAQWATGRAIDFVHDRRNQSIPLERHANYGNLRGQSPTLDSLMDTFPTTRVNRCWDEGAHLNHTTNTVHVMRKSPADHLAHELAHKAAAQKYEHLVVAAATTLRTDESLARNMYVQARLKQELHANEIQAQVVNELKLPGTKTVAVVDDIYRPIFEKEFDEHFKTSGGTWRHSQDFDLVGSDVLGRLKLADDTWQIMHTLYPELSNYESRQIKSALDKYKENYPMQKAFDLMFGASSKGLRMAMKCSTVEHYVNHILGGTSDGISTTFKTAPELAELNEKITAAVTSRKGKVHVVSTKANRDLEQIKKEYEVDLVKLFEPYERAVKKTAEQTAEVHQRVLAKYRRLRDLTENHVELVRNKSIKERDEQFEKYDKTIKVRTADLITIRDQQLEKAETAFRDLRNPIDAAYAQVTRSAREKFEATKQKIKDEYSRFYHSTKSNCEQRKAFANEAYSSRTNILEEQLAQNLITASDYKVLLKAARQERQQSTALALKEFSKAAKAAQRQVKHQQTKAKDAYAKACSPHQKLRREQLGPIEREHKFEIDQIWSSYFESVKPIEEPIIAAKKASAWLCNSRIEWAERRLERVENLLYFREFADDYCPEALQATKDSNFEANKVLSRCRAEADELGRQRDFNLQSLKRQFDEEIALADKKLVQEIVEPTKRLPAETLFSAIDKYEVEHPHNYDTWLSNREINQALFSTLAFQKASYHWWQNRSRLLEAPVESGRLPLASTKSLGLLGKVIRDNHHLKSDFLSDLCERWLDLSPEQQMDMAGNPHHQNLIRTLAQNKYQPQNPSLATLAYKHKIPIEDYRRIEPIFEANKNISDAFPTNRSWTSGKYKGFFLRRDNPLWYFAGDEANCCIRIGGVNEKGLLWTHKNEKAGMFWVIDQETGETVAVSRAWHTQTPRNPELESVCFNNVEAKGIGDRQSDILAIYKHVSRDLLDDLNLAAVAIGTGNSDLNLTQLPTLNNDTLPLPQDYPATHHDTYRQRLLARRPELVQTLEEEMSHVLNGADEDSLTMPKTKYSL